MKITEKQLQQLKDLNDSRVNEILGVTLEVGKWYKYENNENVLFFIENICDSKVSAYGIDCTNEWFNTRDYKDLSVFNLATHEKIENALIKEAKRRGYENGCRIKALNTGDIYKLDGNSSLYESETKGFYFLGVRVFQDGVWAEIIDEKAEIKEEIKAIEERLKELRDKL